MTPALPVRRRTLSTTRPHPPPLHSRTSPGPDRTMRTVPLSLPLLSHCRFSHLFLSSHFFYPHPFLSCLCFWRPAVGRIKAPPHNGPRDPLSNAQPPRATPGRRAAPSAERTALPGSPAAAPAPSPPRLLRPAGLGTGQEPTTGPLCSPTSSVGAAAENFNLPGDPKSRRSLCALAAAGSGGQVLGGGLHVRHHRRPAALLIYLPLHPVCPPQRFEQSGRARSSAVGAACPRHPQRPALQPPPSGGV